MDGEWTAGTTAEALSPNQPLHERGEIGNATARRPNTVGWFAIVAVLLAAAACLRQSNQALEQMVATDTVASLLPIQRCALTNPGICSLSGMCSRSYQS